MIRNWNNQILSSERAITKYINWQQFTKGTRGKLNEQLFPRQLVIQLPEYVTRILVNQCINTDSKNHNRRLQQDRHNLLSVFVVTATAASRLMVTRLS